MHGLTPNARVVPVAQAAEAAVGDELLGRVLDGEGEPLDGLPRPRCGARVRLAGKTINPLQRAPITEPLDVGVRAINSLLTVGRGQRIGLFAGTGVGKSSLLGMMTRYTTADVVVVGLVGERGREVRDFIDHNLGREGLARAVVVATPSDRSPLMRMRGASLATAIAEYFRDQGKHVLLLMDSLTRYAQAQREIGLAVGEPPTTRGYPPSVFAKLPQLVERAGNGLHGVGSITAFYTVLTEGDDMNDPIADTVRGILDGHIVLSRAMAESGIYPAIDVEASISRVANEITAPAQREAVRRLRQLYSSYQHNRDLIAIGAYRAGSDARVDAALAAWPRIEEFLRQDLHAPSDFAASVTALAQLSPAKG
jgi:flagellum-specific ATP synthase